MSEPQPPLAIISHPDERLRMVAREVADFAAAREFAERMVAAMRSAEGIGLAAPQVGDDRRIIVIEPPREGEEGGSELMMLANPVITERSESTEEGEEGCLSLPGMHAVVQRSSRVTVSCRDLGSGEDIVIEAEGILAVVLQHEIDHLDGILIFDHLSRLKRGSFLSKYRKVRLAAQREASDA